MLCRNRVRDFPVWKRVFNSHTEAHRAAGLHLLHLWRTVGDENDVVFLFGVEDHARAQAFVTDPSAAETGRKAGVVNGEIRFLDDV
jgi:hypothetical protein